MAKSKWSYEEVNEYRRTHNQYFVYYNPEDGNFVVPKTSGLGWTNNWAHPASWLIILAVVILVAYHAFFK